MMKQHRLALLVYVDQTAVDTLDAYTRAVHNLQLGQGAELFEPDGPNHNDPELFTTKVVAHPQLLLGADRDSDVKAVG